MEATIVSLFFHPEEIGIGPYSFALANSIADRGHRVNILTTFPFYPQWKRHGPSRHRFFLHEKIGKLEVNRIATYVPKNPNAFKRILHEAVFAALMLARLLIVRKPDIIICVSPPFLGMVAASIVSRIRSVPLYLHIQDLQPDAAIGLGMLRGAILAGCLYRLELFSYNSARIISAIGEAMVARICSKGVPPQKAFIFPNWYTIDELQMAAAHRAGMQKLGTSGQQFTVLYSGNLGEKQGLDVLIRTAALCQDVDTSIKFVIAGDGVQRGNLERMARELYLRNVSFLGVQPFEKFVQMVMSADCSVILQRKEVVDIVVPSKLMNILALGSPLIASVNRASETAKILSKLPIDVVVEPEDPEKLLAKIESFRNSVSQIANLGDAEIELARHLFHKETILEDVIQRLEKEMLVE